MFLVGEVVEIIGSDNGNDQWIGLQAIVEPWPEDEEQGVDGMLQNWLMPLTNRPDRFGTSEFMWPTHNLKKVG
jgi:hypothetical protein